MSSWPRWCSEPIMGRGLGPAGLFASSKVVFDAAFSDTEKNYNGGSLPYQEPFLTIVISPCLIFDGESLEDENRGQNDQKKGRQGWREGRSDGVVEEHRNQSHFETVRIFSFEFFGEMRMNLIVDDGGSWIVWFLTCLLKSKDQSQSFVFSFCVFSQLFCVQLLSVVWLNQDKPESLRAVSF